MIIPDREQPLLLRELAKLLPERPHPKTVWLWCTKGLLFDRRDPASARIRMESIRRGRDYRSSLEAYWRWLARFNEESGSC